MPDGRQWGPIPTKTQFNVVAWAPNKPGDGGVFGNIAHIGNQAYPYLYNDNYSGGTPRPLICQYGSCILLSLHNLYFVRPMLKKSNSRIRYSKFFLAYAQF